jgi:molybdopterin-containing oxidoreductase family membrane subunit
MSAAEQHRPFWRRPRPADEDLAHQEEHARQRHLLLDPRAPWDVDTDVLRPMYRTGPVFWILFLVLGGGVALLFGTWGYQIFNGIGVENINRPVEWALYITNFVFFIGIGHAGTFISAALRVLNVEWRRPISRAAETVTVFALATAALFPLIHLGRAWKFYWLIPYPNNRLIWPSFHSPIIWDFMAINTYLLGSVMFMYLGLLPDLAMARDHTAGWRNKIYNALALGWRGTEKEWAHLETALNIFSFVIIPVMFSVHTIVSWDFAMTLQSGWHSTIFGPYFIVGALYSGVAAVILVLAIIRKAMGLQYFLREEHFNGMGKLLLILTFTWSYFYFAEYITNWYGQLPIEKALLDLFVYGRAAPFWYVMLVLNVLIPAATLWSRRLRTSTPVLILVCVGILVGMYLERVIIIAVGLGRNELPFDWGIYIPHLPEILITIGAFCLVGFGYLLFSRLFPLIPVWEVQEGQLLQGLKRIGRALVPTRAEPGE